MCIYNKDKNANSTKFFSSTLRWYFKETLYSKQFWFEAWSFLLVAVEHKTRNHFLRRQKKFHQGNERRPPKLGKLKI